MKTVMQLPNNIFIFNLGRLWQAASQDCNNVDSILEEILKW